MHKWLITGSYPVWFLNYNEHWSSHQGRECYEFFLIYFYLLDRTAIPSLVTVIHSLFFLCAEQIIFPDGNKTLLLMAFIIFLKCYYFKFLNCLKNVNSPDQLSKREVQTLKIIARCRMLGNIKSRPSNLHVTVRDAETGFEQSYSAALQPRKKEPQAFWWSELKSHSQKVTLIYIQYRKNLPSTLHV